MAAVGTSRCVVLLAVDVHVAAAAVSRHLLAELAVAPCGSTEK